VDAFAHLASGALIGRFACPTGRRWPAYALFGAAAAISPDIDAPLALFGHEVWAQHHQVYTHSLLGLLWVPALLSWLPFSFVRWRIRYLLSLAGWFMHVSLDFVANWPVPLLWPLTDDRYSLGLLSQDFSWRLDMLLVTGLAATLWDRAMPHARLVCVITWAALAAWLALGLPT
jgi:membrane-bound metal-dependent hydrolase YbcI (DUF457 family)